MAIVGGFLGGGVEMVPAGQMQVLLQWNTEDRQNIEGAVFTLTGTGGTFTANGDSSGRAEIIVPAGEYAITVQHSGGYANDGPQRLIGVGAQSYLVLFDAYTRQSGIVFRANLPNGSTYSVSKESGVVVAQGPWANPLVLTLSEGTYILTLNTMSRQITYEFEVVELSYDDDLTSVLCKIVFHNLYPGVEILLGGETVATSDNLDYELTVPKDTYEASFKYPQLYGNGVNVLSFDPTSVDAKVNTVEVEVVRKSVMNLITSDVPGFTVPLTGTYHIVAIGGGGGSDRAAGGGGSGDIADQDIQLNAGTVYPVTIGAGSEPTGSAGGITSFGTLISVAGGSTATGDSGANGGAGGGGVLNGGNGSFGGGGGGGDSDSGGDGGDGGPYGGGGGGGGSYNRSYGAGGVGGTYGGGGGRGSTYRNTPVKGSNGTNTSGMDLAFTGTGTGGSAGREGEGQAGGGGGGGYGGNGGNGTSSGGGGGGGGYGGNGGQGYRAGGGGGGYGGSGGEGGRNGGGGGGGYGKTPASSRGDSNYGYSGQGYGSGAGGTGSSSVSLGGRAGCVVIWIKV